MQHGRCLPVCCAPPSLQLALWQFLKTVPHRCSVSNPLPVMPFENKSLQKAIRGFLDRPFMECSIYYNIKEGNDEIRDLEELQSNISHHNYLQPENKQE